MSKGERYAVAAGIAVAGYLLYQISQTNDELHRINNIGSKVDPLLEKITKWFGG